MLKLKETIPAVTMPFTIVAPNDLRNKVITEANTSCNEQNYFFSIIIQITYSEFQALLEYIHYYSPRETLQVSRDTPAPGA